MPLPADLEIQAQEAPLNDKARIALQNLSRKYQDDKDLEKKLKDVAVTITEVSHKINETAYHKKKRHDNKLAKLAARNEEEDADEKQEYDTFQAKVADLTQKMDHSMRQTIDNRIWSEQLPDNVRHVSTRAIDAASQPTQRTTPHNDDSDEDDETVQASTVAHQDTPSALLHAALSTTKNQWHSKSLTDRYAHDPAYASFYSSLWDAQHPTENAPPLPAPALWFAREEDPSNGPTGTQDEDDVMDGDDTDLVLATERISLKCPITLQHYRDPVTSSICNHSFERTAIFDMLKVSTDHVPFTPTQTAELTQLSRAERARRENAMKLQRVRCPTSGCDKFFTESDLHPNPVLLRKVNREIEAQRRANAERDEYDDEDEDEDELQGPRGTQRKPFGLDGTSSPPPVDAKRERGARMKSERRSVVPQTQTSPPSGTQRTTAEGAIVVDLDDDDE